LGDYWLWIVGVYVLNALNHCLSNYTRGLDKTRLFAVSGILYTAVLIAANLFFLLVLRMQAELLNVAGEQYEVIKNYPMPGFQWRLTARVDF
jgi:Na+-driven multidrug efflux pump